VVTPQGRRRADLETWFHTDLLGWFQNRVLPVRHAIADRCGELGGQRQLKGRPLNTADGLIAATALEHDLTVVTRNAARNFCGLSLSRFRESGVMENSGRSGSSPASVSVWCFNPWVFAASENHCGIP